LNPEDPDQEGKVPHEADDATPAPADEALPVETEVEPEPDLEPEALPEPEPPLVLDDPAPPPPPQRPRFEPLPPRPAPRKAGGLGRLFRTLVLWTFIITIAVPVGVTAFYKFVPPPFTILMVQRLFEGKGWDYRWRSINRISPALVQAAIAAEDARFCEHRGFDFEAMEKAWKNNKRGGRVKGGSTISQQTAKNVFLWPARSYVRKGLEAYYTVLIETIWGKRRIMEVYLNVAEMGSGTYGAEAAAQRYFGVSADRISRAQAARLVAILPNPLKYRAVKPGKYVAGRSRRIGAAAGTVRNDGLAACVGKMRRPTAAERAEPAPAQKPTVRRAAPEKKSDPLPVAETPSAEPVVESSPPPPEPVFETPVNSD
jgi:monofunctional biosynthetic peptidoglycan transglycosylase